MVIQLFTVILDSSGSYIVDTINHLIQIDNTTMYFKYNLNL